MHDIKLKPCPFCGSENVEIFEPVPKNAIGRTVHCKNCDVRVGYPWVYDDLQMVDAWNRRSKNDIHI